MFWLIVSIIALLFGHIVKVYRWRLFINLYEKTPVDILLNSLSISSTINFLIPCHIGDLYRIWYSGRKMKNGIKFSLATVVLEHYIDLMVLAAICTILYFMGHNTMASMVFFASVAASMVVLTIFAMKWDNTTKIIISKFAGIFNESIELNILGFSWAFVTIFKRMLSEISKSKVFLSTCIMWAFYLFSYYSLAETFQFHGVAIRMRDVIDIVFNKSSIIGNIKSTSIAVIFSVYLLTPLAIFFIVSLIHNKHQSENITEGNFSSIIPHVNSKDALFFLETFFSGNIGNAYLKGFLEVNRNISILQDYSAGSNAVTYLCTDGNKTFFRKFAIGADGNKLYNQTEWLFAHEKEIPLTKILSVTKEPNYCSYDMDYSESAQNFFTYIHTHTPEQSWSLLKQCLSNLEKGLYAYDKLATKNDIEKYIEQKITKNISRIIRDSNLSDLMRYDKIIINGIQYDNLTKHLDIFTPDFFKDMFAKSPVCDIHGDLTIENIICDKDSYYLIDPNTGNILNCPWLDYGKLFQSLHGGYEFLMRIKNVSIVSNRIDFTIVRSSTYDYLYHHLQRYIRNTFGEHVLYEIYCHELVHWLRLLPYKLNKNGKNAAVFYAGFLIVLNNFVNSNFISNEQHKTKKTSAVC